MHNIDSGQIEKGISFTTGLQINKIFGWLCILVILTSSLMDIQKIINSEKKSFKDLF